jgi:2-polyprenyl-3-methyl-5-hydroxy-6-metoxy-1,4-benzoquinol methylase
VKQEAYLFIESCPLCGSKDFSHHLTTSDFFLTKEEFDIEKCNQCGLLFTNPIPKPEEIGKYYASEKYYSHPQKTFSPLGTIYNTIKNINLRSKYNLIAEIIPTGNLLDIGCGSGDFLKFAKKNGWMVSGIEPNSSARNFASQQTGENILLPEQSILLGKNSFDVITMWHVLEHVLDLHQQIATIKKLAKPNASIIIALPNHDSIDGKKYKQHWAAWDVPRHLYHFDKKSIQQLFSKFGFILQTTYPMKWDAFYVSMLSEKYRGNKLSFVKALFAGLASNWKAKKTMNYSSLIYHFKKE